MAIGPPAVFTPIPTLNGRPAFGLGEDTDVSTDIPQNIVAIDVNDGIDNFTYTGYAIPGALQSRSEWYISKQDYGDLSTTVLWAQGTANSDLVFDSGVTKAILGVTQADPGVISVSSTVGLPAIVWINGIVGMTDLNTFQVSTTIIDATTFSIGIDTTGFDAYISGGTVYCAEFLNYTYS